MEQKLTLKQMAARMNRCERTFKKYVLEYKIPHIRFGRDLVFDPVKVEAHLEALAMQEVPVNEPKQKASKSKLKPKTVNARYAQMLGIS